jgi:hypothetical protein
MNEFVTVTVTVIITVTVTIPVIIPVILRTESSTASLPPLIFLQVAKGLYLCERVGRGFDLICLIHRHPIILRPISTRSWTARVHQARISHQPHPLSQFHRRTYSYLFHPLETSR